MTRLWVILCVGLLGWRAGAQQPGLTEGFQDRVKRAVGAGSRVSVSGQFTVYDVPPASGRPLLLDDTTHSNYVRLDAGTLAVACDRIKSALLKELDTRDEWRGKVSLHLHRAGNLNEQLVIASARSGSGWMYSVSVPDTTDRARLATAVVSVVLLEMANRDADRNAEIPAWLVQGLTRELMLSATLPLMMDQPQRYGNVQTFLAAVGVRSDPLTRAHTGLRARPPLTLEDLSWPEDGGEESEIFRDSAQLFVHELLQLKGGRAGLLALTRNLARNYNWQTTFLEAFRSNFANELEVEKWWALKLAGFTGRDLTRTWPPEESWSKLDELLRMTVQVRTAKDELPLSTDVAFQTIIRDWEYPQQADALKMKVQQLFLLRNWVSQDLVGLVDDYRAALNSYMLRRAKSGVVRRGRSQAVMGMDRDARDAIERLDQLDARRLQVRPKPGASPIVTANDAVGR